MHMNQANLIFSPMPQGLW